MACTNDLNQPVESWDIAAEATLNEGCAWEVCGYNKEFMTESTYAGYAGTNYCTFIFKFDDDNKFACRPVQDGAADPIRITNDSKLDASLTRSFQPQYCDSSVLAQCVGRELQMCDDDAWQHIMTCPKDKTCNASTASCD